MKKQVTANLIVLMLIENIFCYNILVVFPEPTRSHGILGDGYVRALLKAGHNVTYITPFPWKDVPNGLTQVDVSSNLKKSKAILSELQNKYGASSAMFVQMLGHTFAKRTVEHSSVQTLLRNPSNRFHVVVAEWIDSEIYSGFAAVFGCPLIWSISTQMHWQPLRLMDEYPNPAYSADVNSGYTAPLTFAQRMKELWTQIEKSWILFFTIGPLETAVYNEFFKKAAESKGIAVPPYEDISKFYSMMLVNNHPTVGTAWRLPPNVRDIGGYHVEDPPQPLPENLQSIMDNATEGAILFSLGSTVSAKDMPEQIKLGFMNVFKKLNQTVIWKMEEPIHNISDNVYLVEWVPQTSLLANPNMRVFITHGGQLSVIETIHFGVPAICIPQAVDQYANTDSLVKKGVSIVLEFNDETPQKLEEALEEIFRNSSYQETMKNLSEAYHDRPLHPALELAHWVQHAGRMRGATLLRSPALLVPTYQKCYIDLAAIVVFVIISIVILCKLLWWGGKKLNLCYCE